MLSSRRDYDADADDAFSERLGGEISRLLILLRSAKTSSGDPSDE